MVTCVLASCVAQLSLNYFVFDIFFIAGRIVIGLYGEVVPKTVGILMLFLLFHHVHLSNLILRYELHIKGLCASVVDL